MPSCDFLSSPSMTKMFMRSSAPAMMLKLPIIRNNAPRLSPVFFAAASTSFFGVCTRVRDVVAPSAVRI